VSTLSFLATVRIALVLGCECPRLWGWAKEHLGDLHPVAAISTCEERFFPIELKTDVLRKYRTHRARRARGRGGSGR
jgi:hypothetical protein